MVLYCDEQGLAVRGMDLGRGPQSILPAARGCVLLKGQSVLGWAEPAHSSGMSTALPAVSLILPETTAGYPERPERSTKSTNCDFCAFCGEPAFLIRSRPILEKAEHHVCRQNDLPRCEYSKRLYIYLLNMDTQDGQENQDETPRYKKRARSMIGFVLEVFHEPGSRFWNPC